MLKTVAAFDRIGEENAFAVLARANALAAQGRDIINLGIGQPDFRTPDFIVEAVNGRIPIIVDSGFRRGSDIVKALCIGANAVCVGRPYIWGLGAFGQSGVEQVLELLRAETSSTMQQVGAPSIKQLVPAMVRRA